MIRKLSNESKKDDHLKSLLQGGGITFLIKIGGMISSYLVVLILARKIGSEGVGTFSLFLQTLVFLGTFLSFGTSTSFIRFIGQFYKSKEEGNIRKLFDFIFKYIFPFSIFFSIIFYIICSFSVDHYENFEIMKGTIGITTFTISVFTINLILIEMLRGFGNVVLSEFLRSFFRPLSLLLMLIFVFDFDIEFVLITTNLAIIISLIFSALYVYQYRKSLLTNRGENFTDSYILKSSFPMMLSSLSFALMDLIPLITISIYCTNQEVGVYSVALKIAQFISITLLVVNTINAPKISQLYHNNKLDELNKLVRHSSKLILFSALAISFLILISYYPILLFFGKGFIQGQIPLFILVFSQLINSFFGSSGNLLNMAGYQSILRNIALVSGGLLLILCVLFIPFYGITGAAIAILINILFLNSLSAFFVNKKLKIKSYLN